MGIVSERLPGERFVVGAMALGAVLTVAYWTLWYAARSSVASNHRGAYYEFENAFPLPDGWAVLCLLLAIAFLRRRSSAAALDVGAPAGAALRGAALSGRVSPAPPGPAPR